MRPEAALHHRKAFQARIAELTSDLKGPRSLAAHAGEGQGRGDHEAQRGKDEDSVGAEGKAEQAECAGHAACLARDGRARRAGRWRVCPGEVSPCLSGQMCPAPCRPRGGRSNLGTLFSPALTTG